MNKNIIHLFLVFISILILVSCKSQPVSKGDNVPAPEQPKVEKPKVELMELHTGTFYKEILSNGKLYALRKAEMRFRVNDIIDKINVRNGDEVTKGMVIARLNNFTYQVKLDNSRNQFEKATLELQDELIAKGYASADSTKIPPSVWKIACIRSGYNSAAADLKTAVYDYEGTVLKAPFRGIIASLKSKEQNMVSSTDPFCIVIDNSVFEAEFSVLESELRNLKPGELVSIVPFSVDTSSLSGKITEINPLVNENGLVTVKAQVNNIRHTLFEGMNVQIIVKKSFPGQLVVPKQAVVLRTGREVVFTYENGLAQWNYVKIGDENSTSYTITEGLKPGVKVIITGNLNIGHDAEVEVIKNEE
jgi:membrane fusion protein, multidrug efflux system